MSSLHLPQRRTTLTWGAAAVTAAALYGLGPLVVLTTERGAWAILLAAAVVVLLVYAIKAASPLSVFLLLLFTVALGLVADFGAAAANSCSDSHAAGVVKAVGVYVLLGVVGTIGLARRGRLVLLVPGAAVAAGVWVALISHAVPGWSGACFD